MSGKKIQFQINNYRYALMTSEEGLALIRSLDLRPQGGHSAVDFCLFAIKAGVPIYRAAHVDANLVPICRLERWFELEQEMCAARHRDEYRARYDADREPDLVIHPEAPCLACGKRSGGYASDGLCASCYGSMTRLERIARGWEPDVYALHREDITARNLESDGENWGMFEECPEPNFAAGIGGSLAHPETKDLGRRCYPPEFWTNEGHRLCDDYKRKPLPVDDQSGDDVCADAPGSDRYFGVKR